MSRRKVGWVATLGFLVTLVLVPRTVLAEPPKLAWTPPTDMKLVTSGRMRREGSKLPSIDPALPVVLKRGALLLIPAGPGDPVRIEGHGIAIGFGSGKDELPDAISWVRASERTTVHETVVPSWSSARFVVVRTTVGPAAMVRAFVGTGMRLPMAWYRADEDVAAWIFDDRKRPMYEGELAVLMPEIRRLDAERSALGALARTSAGRAFLQAEWVEAATRRRPMDAPFAARSTLAVEGGRILTENETVALGLDEELDNRVLARGERVRVLSADATAVSLVVRVRAVGRSLVRVREGDRLLVTIELEIPRRAQDLERWAPPRLVRLVPRPGAPLTVETERGEALLTLSGYRQWSSLFDGRGIRNRVALLEQARSEAPHTLAGRALAALAEISLTGRRAAVERLTALARLAGLSPELRALVSHELARRPFDAASGAPVLTDFWALTRGLRREFAAPLRRSALEGALQAGVSLPFGSLPELEPHSALAGSELEDRIVVDALRDTIAPPTDRARPKTAVVMDELLARAGPRDDLTSVAQRAWRKSAPWAWAEPADDSGVVTRLRPVYDTLASELCTAEAPEGLRWLLVDQTPTEVVVVPGPGTHARVPLRGEIDEVRPESLVTVDDIPLAVHGAAGLPSVVALSPGRHRLLVRTGSPVLARIPLATPVPCARLREVERWVYVEDTARFVLVSPGVPSVASVIIDPESMEGRERTLTVEVGDERYDGWFGSGASGSLELPVDATAEEVRVRVDRPALVRVRLRLHPRALGARAVRPSNADRPRDFEEGLEAVRNATRYLRLADTDEDRKKLRLDRARALDAVGYPRLSDIDRSRAGHARWHVEQDVSSDYVELPEASPATVVLGHLGKIPPLPIPEARGALERAHRARASGRPARAVLAELGASADRSSAADALLLAAMGEELEAREASAAAYERIGEAHAAGEAFARAALLYTDAAVAKRTQALGLRAYALARRAESLGAIVSGTLGRLDQAIAWQSALLDSAAGLGWIEEARIDTDELGPSERIRSALLDAPPLVRLFGGPEIRLGVERVRGQALDIERVCHALEGPREACDYRVELDGKAAECVHLEPLTLDGVARPTRCRLSLPLGARKVVIRAPESLETVGFVHAQRVDDGVAVPLTVVGRWYETAPERAARMALLGPAVLRIAARTYAGAPTKLTVRIRSVDNPGLFVDREILLDGAEDRFARRAEGGARVTRVVEDYVPVPFEGPNTVELSSPARVLVRVKYAAAVALPRSRAEAAQSEPVRARSGSVRDGRPPRLGVLVGRDPSPGLVTLRGYATALTADLVETDVDPRTTYGELGSEVHRAIVLDRLWADAGAFGRVRSGPESFGGRVAIEATHEDLVPGAFLRGRFVAQPFEDFTGLGFTGQAGTFTRVALDEGFGISPLVAVVVRDPDERAAGLAAVDPDVRTSYAENHPWSLDGAVHADQRIAVDALLRYGVLARILPDFRGLDRGDASARARVAPGSGAAPSVEVVATASFRPAGPLREEGFVRVSAEPSVLIWQWQGPVRLSANAGVGFSTDYPASAGRGDEFAAGLTLAGDLTFGRALADFPPVERTFRSRLEEGALVPTRSPPTRDPYWEEP